jgi:hypothetical protein
MLYKKFKRLRSKADRIYGKRTQALRDGNISQAAKLRVKWQAAHNAMLQAWEDYREAN